MRIPDGPSKEDVLTSASVPSRLARPRGSEGGTPSLSRRRTYSEEVIARTMGAAGPAERSRTEPTVPDSLPPDVLHGRVEKISATEMVGWAWDPQIPDKRIQLEVFDGRRIISVVLADEYRPYLLHLGCGDGRHGFTVNLTPGMERGLLSVRCADTGAMMPGSPFLMAHWPTSSAAVLCPKNGSDTVAKMDSTDTNLSSEAVLDAVDAPLLKQPKNPGKLRSVLSKLSSGQRIKHNITRDDVARCRILQRLGTDNATEAALSLADCVRETATTASGFVTDSMLALWLSRPDVRRRFERLDTEEGQYALLIWFLALRPVEEGLTQFLEPIDPILAALSETIVARDSSTGLACTALMLAAYCYVRGHGGDMMPSPVQQRAGDIVAWFFCEGAYYLRISHAVPPHIRAALAAPRAGGLSPVLQWLKDRVPACETQPDHILQWLDSVADRQTIVGWKDLLRETLAARGSIGLDGPLEPRLPAVSRRLRVMAGEMTDFAVVDGRVEYMSRGGSGERLLLRGEWYSPEPTLVWSRTPISTILFSVTGSTSHWFRLGLLFDLSPQPGRKLSIIVNHNPVWAGTAGEASANELIIACPRGCLMTESVNLLQFGIEEPFIPSEHSVSSSDNRMLGLGLKRFWFQWAGALD